MGLFREISPLILSLFVLTLSSVMSIVFMEHQGLFVLNRIELRLDAQDWPTPLQLKVRGETKSEFQKFIGQSLWTVSIVEMDQKLHGRDWVLTSHISKSWPNRIRVNVKVKSIAFYLMSDLGKLTTVFSDGSLSENFPSHLLPSRPIAREIWFYDDFKLRIETVELLKALPTTGLFSQTSISDISWSAFDGFSLRLLDHKTKVLLGSDNFEKKVKRVAQVIEYLDTHKKTGRVIDAAYSQKVLVRLRNGP